jgi:prevent-host-death family protein
VKNVWQLQEAKNQLSTVVRNALTQGDQTITLHGKPVVKITAIKKQKDRKPKQKLSEFFSVLRGVELDLERIQDYPRDINL